MSQTRKHEYQDQLRVMTWLEGQGMTSPADFSHAGYQWLMARLSDFEYSEE
jgi:hypothetical protein